MAASATSSGLRAAGNINLAIGRGLISSLQAFTDGTNIATVTIYDNAIGDTSGTVLARLVCPVASGSTSIVFTPSVRYDNGLTISVTGTGTPQGIVTFGA